MRENSNWEKGKPIFSVDLDGMRKHKKDALIWMGGIAILSLCGLAYTLLEWESVVDNPGINAVGVALLYVFTISATLFLFVYLGLKPQAFIVYEGGISPPLKPWRMLFVREYFIPYKKIGRVDLKDERLVLKDGREIALASWFLYNFLSSEGDVGQLEKLLRVIHDFIEEMNAMEVEGEETDWTLKGDGLGL